MTKTFLIDVRSPAEFAAGDGLAGAINIEYTQIDQLAADPRVDRGDDISLYCRSGRRSAIALATLTALGFRKVRDIGDLEQAEETLRVEKQQQQQQQQQQQKSESAPDDKHVEQGSASKETLESSTRTLLEGLRALE